MPINSYPPPSLFYCNDTHKIAYLKVPKCGCSSIAHFIASLKTKYIVSPIWKEENLKHHFDKVTSDERELPDYFTFTFVRHPLTRFLSFYSNWIVDPPHDDVINHYKKFGFYKNMPLEICVRLFVGIEDYSLLDEHTMPMHSIIFRNSTSRVKYIGKLENLKNDFSFVQHACRITIGLPHKNKGNNCKEFSKEVQFLIYEYYKKDYELFGYEEIVPQQTENVPALVVRRNPGEGRHRGGSWDDPREHFCLGDMTFILLNGVWKETGVNWLWMSNCAEFEINSYSDGELSFVVVLPDVFYHKQVLPLLISVILKENQVCEHIVREAGESVMQFHLEKGVHRIKIFTDKYVIPNAYCSNCDNRKLSVIVKDFRLT